MGQLEKKASPLADVQSDIQHGQTEEHVIHDQFNLNALGYQPELRRNRSMFTLLFQSLAIAAIPYGFGAPLISAVYGGGQLAMFLGWVMILIVDECIAISLGELASRYPTSAGPYYWSFQVASPRYRTLLSFITGWTWLVGNWTITLSVNFGFASLLAATVALYYPEFSAIGMITSMAEECGDPTTKLPKALSLSVPVGGIAGLFFIIPICATLPALADILDAPLGQALPYIYLRVMGSPGGALALTVLILVVTLFCSISITVAASRCTWAFARDKAIPLSRVWFVIDKRHETPIWALVLTTVVQMLLGLIYLGSSTAFNAFVSVGVMALAVSYGIPIFLSMINGRRGVNTAPWTVGKVIGWAVNGVALAWICFEVILFSMPTAIPV
ncbi:hypothetical protein PG994_000548 [Apiospora phragmitis]|uniref:Amino acid permease n=1 Tax=Apiospora phragmitis TaxID=2905665 RepID=A0ABR1X6J0_9PEZI